MKRFSITVALCFGLLVILGACSGGNSGSPLLPARDRVPPAEVTGTSVAAALQTLTITWDNPSDADFSSVNIYYRQHGGGAYALGGTKTGTTPGQAGVSYALTVLPDRLYDVTIRTADAAGNESLGLVLDNAGSGYQTAFTGTGADWLAGQAVTGLNGNTIYFTWNDTDLFAGVGASNGSNLLSIGDEFWVIVDTDPATDATGSWGLFTSASGHVIAPFGTDYVLRLKILDATTAEVSRYDGTWTALPNTSYNGDVDELKVAKASLGDPSSVRLAFIVVAPSTNTTYELAPKNGDATDVFGKFGSLTASFASGTSIWDTTKTAQSASAAVSPLVEAANLVDISVDRTQAANGVMQIEGSLRPLSWTLADSVYQLRDDGTRGDQTATDDVYSGRFNFGAATSELSFKFNDNGTTEPKFGVGIDRIYTLSGSAETMPQLTWNTVYSATTASPVYLNFSCFLMGTNLQGSGTDTYSVLGSIASLGNWTPNASAASAVSSGGTVTMQTDIHGHDFVTTPLLFKIYNDNSTTWEADPNHSMNDDVINSRWLTWTADDGTLF